MRLVFLVGAVLACLNPAPAQTPPAPVTVDLHNALDRAKGYSQQFLASATAASLAREDKAQAKSALLPTLSDLSQYIYTQGNGTPSGTFVANDGVHVYNEQAVVHADLFSPVKLAEYRRTMAAEAVARARQDIAVRGLAAVVVQNYYAVVSAQRHLENARRSVVEAQQFFNITQEQEQGGEAAHADVIKAQLQLQQRQREQMDAGTNTDKAKLNLGVMLFPSFSQPFNVLDDLSPDTPLPPVEETRALAVTGNPDLLAAQAGVQQAGFSVKEARGAYFPSFTMDYYFGIDANVFGVTGPDSRQNLGSVVAGSMTVPIWNWGALRSKVRQAELTRQQAETDLALTSRQIEAGVEAFYLEARAAQAQLDSLRSSVGLAAESLRLTVLRYQAGEAVALEVVDAQNTSTQARNAYDDGLTRYRLALASIELLTGRF
jgi:outer membrane protein TolC